MMATATATATATRSGMGHDLCTVPNDFANDERRRVPCRSGSHELMMTRDEHALLRSKLRGLRRNGVRRTTSGDSSMSNTNTNTNSSGNHRANGTACFHRSNSNDESASSAAVAAAMAAAADAGATNPNNMGFSSSNHSTNSAATMSSIGSSVMSNSHNNSRKQQQQARDDQQNLGSNRSITTQDSLGSAGTAVTAYSSDAVNHVSSPRLYPNTSTTGASTAVATTTTTTTTTNYAPASYRQHGAAAARRAGGSRRTHKGTTSTSTSTTARQDWNNLHSDHGSVNSIASLASITTTNTTTTHPLVAGAIPPPAMAAAAEPCLDKLSLHRNGAIITKRCLGVKQISTTRIVEPVSPMISTRSVLSPLKTPSSNTLESIHMPVSMPIRNHTSINGNPRLQRPSLTMAMLQQGTSLDREQQDDEDFLHQSCPARMSLGDNSSHHLLLQQQTTSTRSVATMASSHTNNNRLGLRARREASVASRQGTSNRHLANRSQRSLARGGSRRVGGGGGAFAAADASPSSVMTAADASSCHHPSTRPTAAVTRTSQTQVEQEPLYQPTQEDWAVLYNRHVEELERKDLEIAMKLSTLPQELRNGDGGDGDEEYPDDEETDAISLEGIELALEVSLRETRHTDMDEEEMLQMVLEMSRNDALQASFAIDESSFVIHDGGISASSLGTLTALEETHLSDGSDMSNNAMLNIDQTIPESGDPNEGSEHELGVPAPDRPLTEEEELERVLKLSEEMQAQQPLPGVATGEEEDEELLRVLQLSQQQQQTNNGDALDADEELLRVLQLSQKEARDQEKERETVELVLELSRQHSNETSFW